ncbi:hypothetical protein BDV12DRAFT_205214 [Aspergillus spectabilis]
MLKRLPPSNWYIESAESDSWLLIEVEYGDIPPEYDQYAMYNLSTIPPAAEVPTFQATLLRFLSQLNTLDTRWKLNYEPTTENILSAAARLQTEIISHNSGSSASTVIDLSGESTVITLALHCLIVIRDLTILKFWLDPPPTKTTCLGIKPEAALLSKGRLSEWHADASVEDILEDVTFLSFQLLDTQDPQHWPTVLYVLMIIHIIEFSLDFDEGWMENIGDAGNSINPLFQDLARYYYVSTKGGFVLSPPWSEAEYAVAAGHSQIALKHAAIMRDIWLSGDGKVDFERWDNDECYRGIDGFEH